MVDTIQKIYTLVTHVPVTNADGEPDVGIFILSCHMYMKELNKERIRRLQRDLSLKRDLNEVEHKLYGESYQYRKSLEEIELLARNKISIKVGKNDQLFPMYGAKEIKFIL